ncbi:MAG: 16S rRNA (uracil(1498)-N(3))-methyltransferase [Pseudomonadota bacterium]
MSHIARLYTPKPLAEGEEISLPADQSRYLTRVMRLEAGAIVRAFNGADGEWQCTLAGTPKSVALVPQQQVRLQSSSPDLKLLFAPIKKARTDFIIEKATELGVRTIQPVFTQYSQSNRVRIDRFESLAIEAAEQSERMDVPQIHEARALPKLLSEWDASRPLIFCDESPQAISLATYSKQLNEKPAAILVGPEGGFSPKEWEMLRSLDFVMPITLGPRILRAETAVVSALSLWQSLVGDWQKAPYLAESELLARRAGA